ncbi:MAG: hypothetical protein V8Q95_08390 [Collinsella sp.]
MARANGVRRVSSVTLLLGEVSGVVPDLLLDAWRWAADKKPITAGRGAYRGARRGRDALRGVWLRLRDGRARQDLSPLR